MSPSHRQLSRKSSAASSPPSSRLGRSGPRSRNGCWTCRGKKVKCDEVRPTCGRCIRLRLDCDFSPRIRYPTGSSSSASIAADYCAVLDLSTRQLPKEGARRVDTTSPDGSECSTLAHELVNVGSAAITCPPDSPKFDTAGGVALGNQELEAIRHFRDSFAPLYITKNPDYSVFSVLLQIAKDDAILMHLVIAIGCREIDFRRQSWRKRDCRHREDDQGCGSAQRSLGLSHYSVALRAMSALVANGPASTTNIDLDTLTSILLLMIMYEQIHGDPRCRGLSTHLLGASLILERYYGNVLRDVTFLPQTGGSQHQRCALARRAKPGTRIHLSLYSARLLVRISGMDVIASFYGLGGQVTGTLLKMMAEDNARRRKASPGLMDSLSWLHRYSNPLYRAVWGDVYPQTEMVDDLENRTVYDLLGACTQLRFRISQLTNVLSRDDHGAKAALIADVEAAIQDIGHRFADLLEVAAGLSLETDNSHRLVANLRWIVPRYYTELILFLRITSGSAVELRPRREDALRIIVALAVQGFRYERDMAMLRIANPLFIVALETDDELHRQWVLERFEGLGQFGEHFRRMREFLERNIGMPQASTSKQELRLKFLDEASSLCFCLL